jgi:hypothetical protein
VGFEGFEQQLSGFFHPWIIDQLGVMKGFIARGFIAGGFRIVAQQGTYCRGVTEGRVAEENPEKLGF